MTIGYEGPGANEFLQLQQEQEEIQWRKSDVLAEIREQYGESAIREIAKEHRLTPAYLVRLARVASAIPSEERDEKLSFSHHMVAFAAGDWKYWVNLAAENDFSLQQLRDAIRTAAGVDPHGAVRRAGHAARSMRSAADEAEGTPSLSDVSRHAEAAYHYVQKKTGPAAGEQLKLFDGPEGGPDN